MEREKKMITARDAIAAGRALLGTPYAELDCINFIKRIIRTAPGGVPGYTVAGTNTLWSSYNMAEKYRDLTWTQEGVTGARAGMLAFKRRGDDVHHVGLVTGEGTVLHSSSARGCVVETALDSSWSLLAKHRYIKTAGATSAKASEGGMKMDILFQAVVNTASTGLNLRSAMDAKASRLGSIPRGSVVDVLDDSHDEWWRVRYSGMEGYACCNYLRRVDADAEEAESVEVADGVTAEAVAATTLLREDAVGCITLMGRWRVAQD